MDIWWMVDTLGGGLAIALLLRGLIWTADERARMHASAVAQIRPVGVTTVPSHGKKDRLRAALVRLIGTSRRVHGAVVIAAGCI